MNRHSRNSKLVMGLGAVMMTALLLSGCAQTVAPEPNIDNAMNYWAKGLDQRLATLGIQNSGPIAANN